MQKNALGLGEYGSDDELEQLIEDDDEGEAERGSGGILAGALTPGTEAEAQQSEPASAEVSGEGADMGCGTSMAAKDPSPGGASHLAALRGLPPELQKELPGEPNPTLVSKVVALKRTNRSFNNSLRSHKGYKNPDLLTKLVEHWQVDQYGSAFDKEVFDPHSLPEDDKIGSLMVQCERDQERKKLARENLRPDQLRAGAGVEFQRGQGALGVLPGSTAGVVNAAMLRQQAALQAALAVNMAAVKRSKWDTASGK